MVILAVMIMAAGSSCERKPDTSGRENAKLLYSQSVNLIHLYLDSVTNCRDSAAVAELNDNFVESVARLNFRFPPNTDLHLTENENEILAKMTSRFAGLSRLRLKKLAGHPADSLRRDSSKMTTKTNVKKVIPSPPASRNVNSQNED